MEAVIRAARLLACTGIVALAACSGGGGGGFNTSPPVTQNTNPPANTSDNTGKATGGDSGTNTASNNSSGSDSTSNPNNNSGTDTGGNTNTGTSTTPPPAVTLGTLAIPNAGGIPLVKNFTTNLPPVGTPLPLGGLAVQVKSDSVTDGDMGADAKATFRGTVTSNGITYPVFDLSVPAISLQASNVRGDGTAAAAAGGGTVVAGAAALDYTLLGAWAYTPSGSNTKYLGQVVTGFNTPQANVPTTGTATYTGTGATGAVVGAYFIPDGAGGITSGTLSGSASLNVDFSADKVSGSLSGMTATPAGSNTSQAWNSVILSGSLHRTDGLVTLSGQTNNRPPATTGSASFPGSAEGYFNGLFYGPNAEEVGAAWTLVDPQTSNGHAAFGTFAAKK